MGDLSHKEMVSTYRSLLRETGFSDIEFEDVSKEYLGYVKALDVKLRSEEHRSKFLDIIDSNLRRDLIESNVVLLNSIEQKWQMSMRIRAFAKK